MRGVIITRSPNFVSEGGVSCCNTAMSRSHHFRGVHQYAEQLMDLAEGRPAFTGRGQKPSNKHLLVAIASIKKCRQGSFFQPSVSRPCSCGWHTKAAARKKARQAQSLAAASSSFLNASVAGETSHSSPSPASSVSVSAATATHSTSSLSPPFPSVSAATATHFSEPSLSLGVCCNCYTFDQLQQHHCIHQHHNHFSRPAYKVWIWTGASQVLQERLPVTYHE